MMVFFIADCQNLQDLADKNNRATCIDMVDSYNRTLPLYFKFIF